MASSGSSQGAPRVQFADLAMGGSVARSEPQDERRLGRARRTGRRQLEPAGEHRVDDDRIAFEIEDQELARAGARARGRWPASASSSAGVPRTASGAGRLGVHDGRPPSAAWNASATTVRSGSSGTERDCSRAPGVLDSPGLSGPNCRSTTLTRCDHEGADGGPPPHEPLLQIDGLSTALGPFRFPGRGYEGLRRIS